MMEMNYTKHKRFGNIRFLSLILLCLAFPVHAATNANIKTELAALESDLIRQGKPTDPITKLLGSGSSSLTDELRAFFFELEKDQLPMRQMRAYYDNAGKQYDSANEKLLDGLAAYNTGDQKMAEKHLVQAKAIIQLMRQDIELGVSLYPEVIRVSNTLFITNAAKTPLKWTSGVISFLVPVSDSLTHFAANPDTTLNSEIRNLAVAEFLQTVSLGASKYLVEDSVNKTVGQSFVWKSLGVAQKEEIKQDIMRRIAEDSNILADSALVDPVTAYVEKVMNEALVSQAAPTTQDQKSPKNAGFFSGLWQIITKPFKFLGNIAKGIFTKNDSTTELPDQSLEAEKNISKENPVEPIASPKPASSAVKEQKSQPPATKPIEQKAATTPKTKVIPGKIIAYVTDQYGNEYGGPYYGFSPETLQSLRKSYGDNYKPSGVGSANFELFDALGERIATGYIFIKNGYRETPELPPGKYTLIVPVRDSAFYQTPVTKVVELPAEGINLGTVKVMQWGVARIKVTNEVGTGLDARIMLKKCEITDEYVKEQDANRYPKNAPSKCAWLGNNNVPWSVGHDGKIGVYPSGNYAVEISAYGYTPTEKSFSVNNRDIDLGTVVLKKQ